MGGAHDRDVGLDAFDEEHSTTKDSTLAVDALVEGEASLHEARYAAAAIGLDPSTLDFDQHFEGAIEYTLRRLPQEPSQYISGYRSFPYTFGARYAYLLWKAGGTDRVIEQYASPALTSRAMMASVDEVVGDEPAPAVTEPVPPAEWLPFTQATLGAFGVYLVVARATASTERGLKAALAWRNDRLFVYETAPGAAFPGSAFSWRLAFATEADALDVTQAVNQPFTAFGARQAGTVVTIALRNNPMGAELEWAFGP